MLYDLFYDLCMFLVRFVVAACRSWFGFAYVLFMFCMRLYVFLWLCICCVFVCLMMCCMVCVYDLCFFLTVCDCCILVCMNVFSWNEFVLIIYDCIVYIICKWLCLIFNFEFVWLVFDVIDFCMIMFALRMVVYMVCACVLNDCVWLLSDL